jgi:hypothetical protein
MGDISIPLRFVRSVRDGQESRAFLSRDFLQQFPRPDLGHSPTLSCLARGRTMGHAGKQSQAPKQVLGVVTLHAICEE